MTVQKYNVVFKWQYNITSEVGWRERVINGISDWFSQTDLNGECDYELSNEYTGILFQISNFGSI